MTAKTNPTLNSTEVGIAISDDSSMSTGSDGESSRGQRRYSGASVQRETISGSPGNLGDTIGVTWTGQIERSRLGN